MTGWNENDQLVNNSRFFPRVWKTDVISYDILPFEELFGEVNALNGLPFHRPSLLTSIVPLVVFV